MKRSRVTSTTLVGGAITVIVLAVLFWIPPEQGNAQDMFTLDMSNLGKAWQDYVAAPGAGTALNVYNVLPASVENTTIQVQPDLRTLILSKMNVLESQVYSGERNAVKMGFRLFAVADEPMKIALYKILGYMLRFNTTLFLEELQAHEGLVPDLTQLLCSFQLEAPDDNAKQKLERNIRLKALEYIDNKALKGIKKKCQKILKKIKI